MNDLKQTKFKVKVHPFNQKQKKYCRLLEKYYGIAPSELIDAIKIEIFHPKKNLKERKKAYKQFESVIFALKPIFKELVYERNRIFRENGDKNYFDFITRRRGIPPEKLTLFFQRADEVIKDINQNLPLPKRLPQWYWSKFNIPDSLYFFCEAHRYSIPNDVYHLAKDAFPEIEKILPRIGIGPVTDFNPSAKFIKETKSVFIKVPSKPSIYNALSFVHELGHALSFIRLADEGIDPLSKSYYWHETEAYKFKFQFEEKCLPKEVKNASRGEILGNFFSTFFEYEIYNNPDQDFDKAYAKARNRCYPGRANQEENPFYVLESGFMNRPCDPTASVVCTELLASHLREINTC